MTQLASYVDTENTVLKNLKGTLRSYPEGLRVCVVTGCEVWGMSGA